MDEHLLEAREELKRLEHIIYVSLKYTRTVDVIVNALQGLTNIYDLIIEAFLQKALTEKRLDSLPKSPAFRALKLRELYPEDQELQQYLNFYAYLKNILNSPHTKREEYRRHVALIVEMDHATTEIDIDNLSNCEKIVQKFYTYACQKICGIGEREED